MCRNQPCYLGTLILIVGLFVVPAHRVSAQGSSGLFGSRSVGAGGIQAGSRNTFGGGNSALNANPGTRLSQFDTSSQITGSERFVRGSRAATDFVGADVADTAFVGALAGGTAGMTNFGGGFNNSGAGFAGNRNNSNRQQRGSNANTNNRRVNVRTKLQIGFEYSPPANPKVQTSLQNRLNSVRLRRVSSLTVEMQGRTAILRGQVSRDADRALAVRIAKLEPGVETVLDELTIGTSAEGESRSKRLAN